MSALTGRRHHIAIVGCGFGGLLAANASQSAAVDVTVIDRTNHLFQPRLCPLATGILSEGDIAPPIRDVLRDQPNTDVVLGEVIAVDLETRRLTLDTVGRRRQIAYDSLIVATGASQTTGPSPSSGEDAHSGSLPRRRYAHHTRSTCTRVSARHAGEREP
jgi:NADH:quinone reductase (non-electrogenic)